MQRKKLDGLSVKQARVLIAIVEFTLRENRTPTFREIMKVAGLSSTSMVAYYMDRFEELGFITRMVKKYQYVIEGLTVQPPYWYYGIKTLYEVEAQ